MLYRTSEGIHGERETPERFANGDENDINPAQVHVTDKVLVLFVSRLHKGKIDAYLPVFNDKLLQKSY